MPSPEAIAAARNIAIRIGKAETGDRLSIAVTDLIRVWAAETELRATEELAAIIDEALTSVVWDTAIAVVSKMQDDYIVTAAELARQTDRDDGTDVFTGNASVTGEIIEQLTATKARTLSTQPAGAYGKTFER